MLFEELEDDLSLICEANKVFNWIELGKHTVILLPHLADGPIDSFLDLV